MKKNIVDCKACDGQVSKKAKTCPHCGEDKPWEKRKSFDEHSKPMQVLILLGVGFWAIIFMATVSVPDKPKEPKKELTAVEIVELRQGATRGYCQMAVMDTLKVKGSASASLIVTKAQAVSDFSFIYHNRVRAKNAYGIMLEQPYECHITYFAGEAVTTYLKIGNNVIIE